MRIKLIDKDAKSHKYLAEISLDDSGRVIIEHSVIRGKTSLKMEFLKTGANAVESFEIEEEE